MPRKPLKPCRYPGCPELAEGTYCPQHKKIMDAQYDAGFRDRRVREFYASREWRKLRQNYLIEHPFCVECRKAGRLTKATVIDHIVPIRQGGPALEEGNLQALCASCHGSKSIREGSRFGS